MVEDVEHRAGNLWKTIGLPNLLCDNCRKELPADAIFGRGKHAIADSKKKRILQWCNTCYYYYIHRNDKDLKKLR